MRGANSINIEHDDFYVFRFSVSWFGGHVTGSRQENSLLSFIERPLDHCQSQFAEYLIRRVCVFQKIRSFMKRKQF